MELNWEEKHFAEETLLQILTPIGLHPYTMAWARAADPAWVQGSVGVYHSHSHGHPAQDTGPS